MAKHKCNCPPPGAPMWLGTFADLMSLLMCFFVLLLAFSEMDVVKFKQIAGSMKHAFGVQNQIKADDIPKGTSIIALEFKPGRPEPTPLEIVNQRSDGTPKVTTSKEKDDEEATKGIEKQKGEQRGGESASSGRESAPNSDASSEAKQMQASLAADAKKIAEKLQNQISDGALEMESSGQQLKIRIREKGAFAAGSGFLQPRFRPIIREIGELIKDVPGIIVVSGYTDDNLVRNELYSSNWDLSSARAVSVAQELIKVKGFNPQRMKVVGMAYNKPLVPNTSDENRRKNRRVEITIMQGKAMETEEITVTP